MLSKKFYALFSRFILGYCVLVILWGAYVRASGSGAGCGAHWPLCNGAVIPKSERIQTLIEYVHRSSSGISLVLISLLCVFSFRLFEKKSFQRKISLVVLFAVLMEALLGALLVLLRHVELDQSLGRVISISLHQINTLLLLGALTVLNWAPQFSRVQFHWCKKTIALGGLFLFLAAFGAMAALGDTLFPAATRAIPSDTRLLFLLRIRIFHPLIALGWYAASFLWTLSILKEKVVSERLAMFFLAVTTAQVLFGALNVVLLAPIWGQIIHLLLADFVWILFVSLVVCGASGKDEMSQGSAAVLTPN